MESNLQTLRATLARPEGRIYWADLEEGIAELIAERCKAVWVIPVRFDPISNLNIPRIAAGGTPAAMQPIIKPQPIIKAF